MQKSVFLHPFPIPPIAAYPRHADGTADAHRNGELVQSVLLHQYHPIADLNRHKQLIYRHHKQAIIAHPFGQNDFYHFDILQLNGV